MTRGWLWMVVVVALTTSVAVAAPAARSFDRVTFTAPDLPASLDYYCRPHALTMRGILKVVAR